MQKIGGWLCTNFQIFRVGLILSIIEDDIWELRPGDNRVFYFFYDKEGKFVLLHHFKKKTQKTPKREIERAKAKRDDYRARKEDEKK